MFTNHVQFVRFYSLLPEQTTHGSYWMPRHIRCVEYLDKSVICTSKADDLGNSRRRYMCGAGLPTITTTLARMNQIADAAARRLNRYEAYTMTYEI